MKAIVTMDERVLRRWFGLEMGSILQGLVTRPRPVTELLAMPDPALPTRSGELHALDRQELQRLHDALAPHERHRLFIPIRVHLDSKVPGDAFLDDPVAVRALKSLGLLDAARDLRAGRFWLGRSLALALRRALPTTVQVVVR